MAIDASIISQGIKPIEPVDPMAIQARVFGLRNLQQQSQLGALDLQQKQKAISDEQTMNRIMQGAYGQSPSQQPGFTGPTQPGEPPAGGGGGLPPGVTKGADGVFTLDPGYLTKAMAQAGIADKIPGTLSSLADYQEKAATLAKTRGDVALQTRDALGALAATIDAAGGTPAAFHMGALMAVHNGQVTLAQVQPYLDRVDADPTQVSAITKELQAGSPKQTELASAKTTADARALAAGKPTDASLAVDAATIGTPKETATAQASAAALDRLKPKQETSLQSENVLLNGKSAMVTFNPKTGHRFDGSGADVTGRTTPIPPASTLVPPNALSDVKESVAGMKDGTLPPMLPGRATKEYLATMAEAHRQGYDLAGAVTDWAATQKHIATMNGAQQLRLNQSINALPDMLDKVDALAAQWKGGRFPILNKANLALAKGGAYGQDVASIANQLDAQIADVTADLGNVYMGGNSPTDHALGLAAKSLSGDWSQKVLSDMTKLARSNVQIRQNSIRNTGVAGASKDNAYATQPDAAAPPAAAPAAGVTVTSPGGKVYTFKSQADADTAVANAKAAGLWK